MTIAQEVTARILDQLKAGVCPWRRPWDGRGSRLMPQNAVTGRGYSGVNVKAVEYLRTVVTAETLAA